MKKLSIITICYNEPKLQQTCENIINQTFQDFEWIVIDGGSNQKTLGIFAKYKKRIDYFISEKDHGIFDAQNKGIKQARGLWVNFMNAGDYFAENNTLQELANNFDRYCEYDVLHGRIKLYGLGKLHGIRGFGDDEINKEFWLNNTLPHQAMFYKRTLFEKHGYFSTKYKICSDIEHNIRLYLSGCTFKSIDCLVAFYDNTGLSSVYPDVMREELKELKSKYYSEQEIEQSSRKQLQKMADTVRQNIKRG